MRDMSKKDIHQAKFDGWTLRWRQPQGQGPFPVIFMLHGWTGDEDAMWVFSSRLPQDSILVAPRAPYATLHSGYSWHPKIKKPFAWVDDYRPAIDSLGKLIGEWDLPEADFSRLYMVGFSQGAALAYTYALLNPGQVTALAGLSGFLPEGAGLLAAGQPLLDMPVFMTHGSLDELVPLERARQAQRILEQAGAYVSFCEDEVGHRLSASCFRNLEIFFERIF